MTHADRSAREITSEIERLEALLAQERSYTRRLEAREAAVNRLCGYMLQYVFTAEQTAQGQLRFSTLLTSGKGAERPGLPDVLAPDLAAGWIRRVFESGEPGQYEQPYLLEGDQRMLRITLLPVPESHDGMLALVGSVRDVTEEHRLQTALQERETQYEQLLELLPDAVIFNSVLGRLLYINSAGVRLLGVQRAEEVVGRSVWELIHPDDRAAARARSRKLRPGDRADLIVQRLLRPDGTEVPVETASVPVRYAGRPAVLSTVRDLSRRRRMEKALSASQELFYKAFMLGPVALCITRLDDAAIVDANRQYAELSGYSRDELIGASAQEVGLWQQPDEWASMLEALRGRGVLYDREYTLRRKDGQVRTVLASLQHIEVQGENSILAIVVDITARRLASRAERESRALLHKVFHASPAGITIACLSDDRFVDVNEAWSALTGYGPEEAVGKTAQELGLWADPPLQQQFLRLLHERSAVYDHEVALRTRQGAVRTVVFSAQRIQLNEEPHCLTVVNDITERKKAEVEVLQAKEEAEEVARVKSAILTNMTHEVRTPLTVILGFTSMLKQGVRADYRRFVRAIERSGRRLLLMLDSILDLAQLEAGTLEIQHDAVDLKPVVEGVAHELRPLAEEKGLTFGVSLPAEGAYARVDHRVVTRILNNLIDNAVKFTEEGGINVGLQVEEAWVRIGISDTGVGIAEAFMPHLFKEFSQESTGLERTHQGSGLGLSVSKRLIELMGGTIAVQSQKGEGSRFVISFPRVRSSSGLPLTQA